MNNSESQTFEEGLDELKINLSEKPCRSTQNKISLKDKLNFFTETYQTCIPIKL